MYHIDQLRRSTPPNVIDVDAWSWWWNYPANGSPPHVMQFDVAADGTIYHADSEDGGVFDPNDWPGDWAPCIPPR